MEGDVNVKSENYKCSHCGSSNVVMVSFRKIQSTYFKSFRCRDCSQNFATIDTAEKTVDDFDAFVLLEGSKLEGRQKKESQVWSAYNEAKTQEKEMFVKILRELLDLLQVEYRKRSGHPNNGLHDMIFACAIKIYSGLSSRRCVSELELLKNGGYLEVVPHFNTLLNYFNDPQMTSILKKLIELSAMPLKQVEEDFSVDASGFSSSIFSRWFEHKWGNRKDERQWVKCHLISGVKTHIITGVEITDRKVADTKRFIPLVNKTHENFKIREISADKAYSSALNLETVTGLGGVAYIPFKSNTTAKNSHSRIWKKMFEYFTLYREQFYEHYHKRSNVESVFHSLKMKFGNSLRCKTHKGMENEILVKVLCYNICVLIQEIHELNLKVDYCAENYPAQQITI